MSRLPPAAFPLPAQTARRLRTSRTTDPDGKTKQLALDGVDHLGLAFHRYVPTRPDIDGSKDEGFRAAYVRALVKRFEQPGAWADVAAAYSARQAALAGALREQGHVVESFEAKTAGRFLVGTGYGSALEIGLGFHHTGGFPFLPGSSVKGVCRTWAEDVEAHNADGLLDLFGTPTKYEWTPPPDDPTARMPMQRGALVFLDALPAEGFPMLSPDVLTPHYAAYYMDGQVPGDWLQPVPVAFLAVAEGVPFRFTLASADRTAEGTDERARAEEAVKQAAGWLRLALAELGGGAKTAAGYGRFETGAEVEMVQLGDPSAAAPTQSAPTASSGLAPAPPVKTKPDFDADAVVTTGGRTGEVRLEVEGLEDSAFPLTGMRNVNEGDRFRVRVERRPSGEVHLVRYLKRLG